MPAFLLYGVNMKIGIYKLCLMIILVFHSFLNAQEILTPKPDSTSQILVYQGFTLQYNELHEQADWVAYRLDSLELITIVDRKDRFKSDKNIVTGSASLADYKGSGYDRGHLAPAADMRWNKQAMNESFYMSNMSPQKPAFNRGIWKELEELVRDFASVNSEIYVITGPVLKPGLPVIGENEVSVPEYYYKAILDLKEPDIKMIAFLLPNEECNEEISKYVITVDSLEAVTGLDFFYQLDDSTEAVFESKNGYWGLDTIK